MVAPSSRKPLDVDFPTRFRTVLAAAGTNYCIHCVFVSNLRLPPAADCPVKGRRSGENWRDYRCLHEATGWYYSGLSGERQWRVRRTVGVSGGVVYHGLRRRVEVVMRWWKLFQFACWQGALVLRWRHVIRRRPRRAPLVVSQTPRSDLPLTLPTPCPKPRNPLPWRRPAPAPEPPAEIALAPSVRYRVEADLDWAARSVHVVEQVDLQNGLDRALDEILFTIEANGETNLFSVASIKAGGAAIDEYTLNASDLIVPLPEPFEPQAAHPQATYDLTIPAIRRRIPVRPPRLSWLQRRGRSAWGTGSRWLPVRRSERVGQPKPHTVGSRLCGGRPIST